MDQDEKQQLIQSEDSVHIKYQKSLCQKCNSSRSQPWDEAYDQFMEYILSHESELKRIREVDFGKMVNGDFGNFCRSLYSYFTKAFGCQLREHGQDPPLELSDFLLERRNNTNLKMSFAIYESIPYNLTSPMIQIHNLEGDFDNLLGKPLNFTWAVSTEWLTTMFWFNKTPEVALGSAFIGNVGSVDIGSYKEMETG